MFALGTGGSNFIEEFQCLFGIPQCQIFRRNKVSLYQEFRKEKYYVTCRKDKGSNNKGYSQPNFIRRILLTKSKINGILEIVFPFVKGYIKEERILVFYQT